MLTFFLSFLVGKKIKQNCKVIITAHLLRDVHLHLFIQQIVEIVLVYTHTRIHIYIFTDCFHRLSWKFTTAIKSFFFLTIPHNIFFQDIYIYIIGSSKYATEK